MKRRAFLVGINRYANPEFDLRGCLNDIDSLSDLLVDRFGFARADITTLTDHNATRTGIFAGLADLLSDFDADTMAVFAVSAHGTQVGINVDDEDDGKNEAIVPHEITRQSLILDDELHRTIAPVVSRNGGRFTAIYDTCHSGNLYRTVEFDEHGRLIPAVINRVVSIERVPFGPNDASVRSLTLPAYDTLSACAEHQTAADLPRVGIAGLSRGAFSYALHECLRENPALSAEDLGPRVLAGIRAVSRHEQTPVYGMADWQRPVIA